MTAPGEQHESTESAFQLELRASSGRKKKKTSSDTD